MIVSSLHSLLLISTFVLVNGFAVPRPNQNSPITTRSIPYASKSLSLSKRLKPVEVKQQQHLTKRAGYNATLSGAYWGQEFLADIIVGNQTVKVIIDTGSANTWVVGSNYTCYNSNLTAVPQSSCFFGNQTYDISKSSTYTPFVGPSNFNFTYGNAANIVGSAGYDTISVGGLAVPQVLFATAEKAAWTGDGISAGVLGLSSPLLASYNNVSDPSLDTPDTNVRYDPWFYQAVARNLTAPFFSMALNRAPPITANTSDLVPNAGTLSFGGLPPNVSVTNTSVTVPTLNSTINFIGAKLNAAAYYTIGVDGWGFPGSGALSNTTDTHIIDSGTITLKLRSDIAAGINAAFTPPAILEPSLGAYLINCSSIPPSNVNITIGGVTFPIDGRDLVAVLNASDPVSGCVSAVQDGGLAGQTFVLGDRFLTNVVSVFDVESGNVTLFGRTPY